MPGRRCSVYGCNNSRVVTKVTDADIVYHSFPKGKDSVSKTIQTQWIASCKRQDKFNPSTGAICSIHFTKNDYERDMQNELLGLPLKKMLKKTAVPKLHLPGMALNTGVGLAKQERQDKINRKLVVKHELETTVYTDSSTAIPDAENMPCEESSVQEFESQPTTSTPVPYHSEQDVNKELLKNYDDLKMQYSNLRRTTKNKIKSLNTQLSYYKAKCKSPSQTKSRYK